MSAPPRKGIVPVSVIVPAYNAASSLTRALDSIAAQTCGPAELFIVDDASVDDTIAAAETWIATHPDIPAQIVKLPANRGAGSARNAGWSRANGEYIAFLDADDAWHPRKLEIQHAWLSRYPNTVLSGHGCAVFREEVVDFSLGAGSDPPVTMYGMADFLIANRISTPSVIVKRAIGPRFVEGKRHSEDYLLWLEIIHLHGPAVVIELPLAQLFKARYGENGLSADHRNMRRGEIDTFARLRRQGIISPAVWLAASTWGWIKFYKRAAERVIGLAPHKPPSS
jgi:glycosyltransferase involved in cell wall biosynthesis